MIHTQLNYQIAHQHADEVRQAAESQRLARSIHAERHGPAMARRIARLRPAFIGRHSLVTSDSM